MLERKEETKEDAVSKASTEFTAQGAQTRTLHRLMELSDKDVAMKRAAPLIHGVGSGGDRARLLLCNLLLSVSWT